MTLPRRTGPHRIGDALEDPQWIQLIKTLLMEVANSGVDFADDRLDYVTVQIDKTIWNRLQSGEVLDRLRAEMEAEHE